MKKTVLIATVMFICMNVLVPMSYAGSVNLAWDSNGALPDGYKIYHRLELESYDYLNPLANSLYVDGTIPPDVMQFTAENLQEPAFINPNPPVLDATDAWDKENSTVHLSWAQTDKTVSINHYFVARAFVGLDYSGDSNEVIYTITKTVPIANWKIYYSLTSGGPWTLLDQIDNIGQATLQVTKPLTVVAQGETKTVYFIAVSFVDDQLYSIDSNEVSVVVDRRVPVPPVNLRINVSVPVQ